jgi:HD-like signal output (HDOD) protein
VHALGQVVMHLALPTEMKTLDRECRPLAAERAALERARLGYDHGAVGAELALRWKFPAEVAEPLRSVSDPLHSDPPSTVAALIHIAAWRARVEVLPLDATQALATCPRAVGQAIGLAITWLPEPGTAGIDASMAVTPMPPLAELSKGLQGMLH